MCVCSSASLQNGGQAGPAPSAFFWSLFDGSWWESEAVTVVGRRNGLRWLRTQLCFFFFFDGPRQTSQDDVTLVPLRCEILWTDVTQTQWMWSERFPIKESHDRGQNWKPGFNWYCSTVIILKGIVWSNTCNVSTNSSLSYRIIGLSFCIEQYIQCEINTFTQMDRIIGAHLYDTQHKNIQVIVFFVVFFFLFWCEAHLKSTDMF